MNTSTGPALGAAPLAGLAATLLSPTLAAIGWLRALVGRSGALDYCETGGFTVHSAGGDFAVTSGADPRFKSTELSDLATSLREAGYLVELARNDTEPCVLVSAPPHRLAG